MNNDFARIMKVENGFLVTVENGHNSLKQYVAKDVWGIYELLKEWTERTEKEKPIPFVKILSNNQPTFP